MEDLKPPWHEGCIYQVTIFIQCRIYKPHSFANHLLKYIFLLRIFKCCWGWVCFYFAVSSLWDDILPFWSMSKVEDHLRAKHRTEWMRYAHNHTTIYVFWDCTICSKRMQRVELLSRGTSRDIGFLPFESMNKSMACQRWTKGQAK